MMSLNRYKLKHLSDEGLAAAKRARLLLEQPERLLGTILLGNNFVNIVATSLGTLIGMRLLGDLGILISTIVLTFLVLVFSEVAPKTLAALQSQRIAFPASLPLSWLVKALSPLVFLLNAIAALVLRPFTALNQREEELSSEELKTIVLSSSAHAPERSGMLMGVLELEDISVSEAMVTRNELQGIDLNDDFNEIWQKITQSEHGRLLVYRDHLDQVEGILHIRDLMRHLQGEQPNHATLMAALRPCVYVPDSTPLRTQLLNFQKQRIRSALVVDEYGDLKGMITLEDILTHIVGDNDDDAPTYTQRQEALYHVEGSMTLRQLNRELGLKLPLDGPNTLSGLIIETLGNFPEVGTELHLSACRLRVLEFADGVVGMVELSIMKHDDDAE